MKPQLFVALAIVLTFGCQHSNGKKPLPSWFGYADRNQSVHLVAIGYPTTEELKPFTEPLAVLPTKMDVGLNAYILAFRSWRDGTLHDKTFDRWGDVTPPNSEEAWARVFLIAQLQAEGVIDPRSANSNIDATLRYFDPKTIRKSPLLSVMAARAQFDCRHEKLARSIMVECLRETPRNHNLWIYYAKLQESGALEPGIVYSKNPGLDLQGAIRTRTTIQRLWPSDEMNVWYLAIEYDIVGEKVRAIEILRKAVAGHPKQDEMRTRLETMLQYVEQGGWKDAPPPNFKIRGSGG